jgi:hypothetical protein
MFRRRRDDLVPMEAVAQILKEARELVALGAEMQQLKDGLLHQTALSNSALADYREQMENASAAAIRSAAGDPGYLTRNTERED